MPSHRDLNKIDHWLYLMLREDWRQAFAGAGLATQQHHQGSKFFPYSAFLKSMAFQLHATCQLACKLAALDSGIACAFEAGRREKGSNRSSFSSEQDNKSFLRSPLQNYTFVS